MFSMMSEIDDMIKDVEAIDFAMTNLENLHDTIKDYGISKPLIEFINKDASLYLSTNITKFDDDTTTEVALEGIIDAVTSAWAKFIDYCKYVYRKLIDFFTRVYDKFTSDSTKLKNKIAKVKKVKINEEAYANKKFDLYPSAMIKKMVADLKKVTDGVSSSVIFGIIFIFIKPEARELFEAYKKINIRKDNLSLKDAGYKLSDVEAIEKDMLALLKLVDKYKKDIKHVEYVIQQKEKEIKKAKVKSEFIKSARDDFKSILELFKAVYQGTGYLFSTCMSLCNAFLSIDTNVPYEKEKSKEDTTIHDPVKVDPMTFPVPV